MNSRQTTLVEKKANLDQLKKDLADKNEEYKQAQSRQSKIEERADDLALVNKEINNIDSQIAKKTDQYQETVRLEKKYQDDINKLDNTNSGT
jgi:chromosome segregation ATPase